MGLYDRYILPPLIDLACGTKAMMRERSKIIERARGAVLEIGAGTGHNLAFYDADAVTHIHALDPSEEMLRRYRTAAADHAIPTTFHATGAEDIGMDSDSIDTVVLTFTLCTIPEVARALEEMKRVLKPGGELLFCEHGLSPRPEVQRWQHRLNRPWGFLAGGCTLNRDIPARHQAAGFTLLELESHVLPRTPEFAGRVFRGVASAPVA